MNSMQRQIDRIGNELVEASRDLLHELGATEFQTLVERITFCLSVKGLTVPRALRLTPFTPVSNRAGASELAKKVRSSFTVDETDPLLDLPELLYRQLGIIVLPINSKHIAGGSVSIDGDSFIFVSVVDDSQILFECARQLFQILGAPPADPHTRVSVDSVKRLNSRSKSPREHIADEFSRNLLLPSMGVGRALKSVREALKITDLALGDVDLLFLSRIFGVRFIDAAKRCERLHLLPRGGAITLINYMNENFGGPDARARQLDLPARFIPDTPIIPYPIQETASDLLKLGKIATSDLRMIASWSQRPVASKSQKSGLEGFRYHI
jgi:hypothetical protein